MPIGKVVAYHTDRGFGFIRPDDGGPDVFFHIAYMEDQTTDPILGARVGYEITKSRSATALTDPTKAEMAANMRYV